MRRHAGNTHGGASALRREERGESTWQSSRRSRARSAERSRIYGKTSSLPVVRRVCSGRTGSPKRHEQRTRVERVRFRSVISNGSHIYVPENTAAFIFSESGIENVITEPGGYEYRDGEKSVLAGDGIGSLFSSVASRFTFGGSRWRRSMWRSSTCVRSAALSSALQRRWSTMTNSMAWIWRYGRGARCH